MKAQTAREVIECLPRGKTHFRYFKDRYAFELLAWSAGNSRRIRDLRRSRFGQLLDKESVRQWLAQQGDGRIDAEGLRAYWREPSLPFLLTLDTWGTEDKYWRYRQTSRPGANLVLQLNFTNHHTARYRKSLKPKREMLFNRWAHPVMKPGYRELYRDTLAWSRIDVDFDSNEALIEELQNDWLRHAEEQLGCWLHCRKARCCRCRYTDGGWLGVALYRAHLEPYRDMWCEALLTATLMFIREELGIRNIFFHTADTGAAMKHIYYGAPPRSLYTQLPRRFCFQMTEESPSFLKKKRLSKYPRKTRHYRWFKLEL